MAGQILRGDDSAGRLTLIVYSETKPDAVTDIVRAIKNDCSPTTRRRQDG